MYYETVEMAGRKRKNVVYRQHIGPYLRVPAYRRFDFKLDKNVLKQLYFQKYLLRKEKSYEILANFVGGTGNRVYRMCSVN
jgi:hypothetical protein